MPDIEKGLPVRTEGDAHQYVRVKLADPTTSTQMTVVDADGNAHIEAHGNNPAGGDEVLRLSELGHGTVNGIYDGTDNTDPSQIGVVGLVRNASPADSQQTLRVTAKANTAGDVRAMDVSLRDGNAEAFSITNPLPVVISGDTSGTEIHNYTASSAVAADGSVDVNYSVANGVTFLFEQFVVDASGRFKAELKIGDGAAVEVFTSKCVRFGKEDSSSVDVTLARPIKVIGTVNTTTVRLTLTNRDDDDPQDIYSLLVGVNV